MKEGQKYGDFVLVNYKYLEELQTILREFIHLPTNAQIMHLENEDPENVFCLSFKTLPTSSNGAPHILEHTVLCGSRKFPIKDPFFSMSRRSLNTFMNAFTGSDFTCYPAASQVEKDFYNLLEVYIDAVFHPLLKELSFLQEGHRLEFSNPTDPSTPLLHKGIVYNEMKGAMSSADSHIWQEIIQTLVPDLPYAFNSGGDPKAIPNITYENLIHFHETFYHPSRCLFFFYGNFSLQKHLDFLAEHAFKGAQKLPPIDAIGHQNRFEKPRYLTRSYPTNETEQLETKQIHVFGFLTTFLLNQDEVLALTILDSVLMDTDASPLKKALLETKLCIDVSSSLDVEMTEIPLVFIFRGVKKEDGPKLEKIFFDELKRICKEGIAPHLIESTIHQLEFSRTEIGGDHSPFGLTLFMRSALTKQHGCSPENSLTLHTQFKKIIKQTEDPLFFSPLIEKYLLNNSHFIHIHFSPDPELLSKEAKEEEKKLQTIRKILTEKQIANILENTKKFENYQEQIERQKLECLPKVSLEDVPVEAREFPLHIENRKNLKIFHHEVFTNHILYADLIFDLPNLTEQELFDLQLYLILWPELGMGNRNYAQNLEFIHAHTGGIDAHASLHIHAENSKTASPSLQIHGKCLERKADKLFILFNEMITFSRLDETERIEDLIKKLGNALQNRLIRNSMRYASQLALCSFSMPNHVNDAWYGLSFYHKVQHLYQNLEKQLPHLIDRLQSLQKKLLHLQSPHLVLSCDKNLFSFLDKQGFFNLPDLPSTPSSKWQYQPKLEKISHQARIIPSPVAFTAQAYKTVHFSHEDSSALQVATLLLENKVLHHRIREQGGAYGSGATYNPIWGHFYFYAYRDPHIVHSLHTFTNSIREIANGEFDSEDLEEAKLGMIQQFDSPVSPGSRAMIGYSWQRDGKTRQLRQNYRDKLLGLKPKDVQTALEKHLLSQIDEGVIATFADKELLDKELPLLEDKTFQILDIANETRIRDYTIRKK